MRKHKNATRGGENTQKGASPTLSSHGGEAGEADERGNDLRDVVALLEEGLSQMGTPFKMPLRFMQSSWLPSEWSLSPEHSEDHPAHKDWMCYCVHIRVTLGEGETTSPHLTCMAWFINCRHVPGWSWRADYQSSSPCPRGGNLILWTMITQRRAPLGKCQGWWIQVDRPSQLDS